jgi:hypothetical protein
LKFECLSHSQSAAPQLPEGYGGVAPDDMPSPRAARVLLTGRVVTMVIHVTKIIDFHAFLKTLSLLRSYVKAQHQIQVSADLRLRIGASLAVSSLNKP